MTLLADRTRLRPQIAAFGNCGLQLLAGALISSLALPGAAQQPSTTVPRTTLETHQKKGVIVYGKYLVVKLPITKGVTLWNPSAIVKGPDGVIYAANYVGEIYTLHDTDGDHLEDTARLFCNVKDAGLRYPTSLAFKGRELYVGTTQEIRIYADRNGDGKADHQRTFYRDFPWNLDPECWTFGLCFDSNGWLYFNLTTDSYSRKPAPDPNKWRGAVVRVSPDGKRAETFATGIRFAPGMTFSGAGDLFLADNKGSQNATEEINHIQEGKFYGNNPAKYAGLKSVPPLLQVKHGNAMGGIRFNPSSNYFDGTAGDLFAACWGSNGRWQRGEIIRVRLFKRDDGTYMAKEFPVVKKLGKIIDLAFGPQGDLYIARFGRENNKTGKGWHFPWPTPEGGIYRMTHAPWVTPAVLGQAEKAAGDIAKGKALFTQRACHTCHGVDGRTDSFGPNLKGIHRVFNTDELRDEIENPGRAIQVGYEKHVLVKRDQSTLMGRLVHSDDRTVTLLVVGNQKLTVPRTAIASLESEAGSMMPKHLLAGLSASAVNDLLAYLQSLEE